MNLDVRNSCEKELAVLVNCECNINQHYGISAEKG
jgi:hypothetical protein